MWLAAIGLAAAQIPLTFGNAILGIVAETRRLFPAVVVDESRMARGTGFMNLLAGGLGAPPMCFGAGGMAAQVACGARTGRAPIVLGAVLLTTAAVSVWNAGVGVVVGVLLEAGLKSRWLRI